MKTLYYRRHAGQTWTMCPDLSPYDLAMGLGKLSKDVGYSVYIRDENDNISHWYVESDIGFAERLDGDEEDWIKCPHRNDQSNT